jgi:hypothetical protein
VRTVRVKRDRRTLELTERWNDVPRGTMDEVSSYVRLDPLYVRRQGRPKDCSTSSSNPILEGPWCRFRRECEPVGDIDTAAMDSLKVLDPERPSGAPSRAGLVQSPFRRIDAPEKPA